ncbi:MAG: thiol:disulfide interchange protein, partial [Bacteroidales bacterium]|nr:thiol:disulfide interchange protein [Bacteroidales bacterium]
MKVRNLISAVFLSLIVSGTAFAQILEPVKFKAALEKDGTETGRIVFTGTIDPGWHVYSTGLGDDGPTSASFNAESLEGVELDGGLTAEGDEIDKFDEVFGMKLRYFENAVSFVQKVRFTKPEYKIEAYLEYGACNDRNCLPPTSVDFVESGTSPAVGAARNAAAPDTPALAGGEAAELAQGGLWEPVADKIQAITKGASGEGRSIWYLLLMGFLGGLLAILMPCIWPIIPMTVSFFMHRSEDKRRSRRDAILYGVSIIVIYLVLGVGITLIFGGNKLNELSTNAIFNIFLFLLLVVFALSFFG